MEFKSRRTVVVCHQGCVASSQPYASQIGLDVLKSGGNAADAAVAVAAALAVTEPYSTGLGGDAFCLFYDARTKTVKGLNGSGRAGSRASLSRVNEDGFSEACPFYERHHGHAVTVPGTAAAWEDTVQHFGSGKMSMQQILRPAIELAETGFPVQYNVANVWRDVGEPLFRDRPHGQDILLGGRAPRHGEIMTLPLLANVLKELASQGKDAFYRGRVARAISQAVQSHGGVLTEEDLASHCSTLDLPLSTDYRGRCRVWEMPPNGQGLAVLLALNILEGFDLQGLQPNSSQYLHLVTEALRLSFADTRWYSTDPSQVTMPVDRLLSKEYAAARRALIDPARAMPQAERGVGVGAGDTVYFCVADKEGNACSFINSIYYKFGSGIVPEGCGFPLQNRGYGFSLDPNHPNVLAGGKRSYHTIIPSMVTCPRTGELLSAFGVMGGHMQPQGHVQVLLNQVEFGMDPQHALDQPRLRVDGRQRFPTNSETVAVEEGISPEVTKQLREMGHVVSEAVSGFERINFGLGQVITRGAWWDRSGAVCKDGSAYWAGCDPRSDGVVAGY